MSARNKATSIIVCLIVIAVILALLFLGLRACAKAEEKAFLEKLQNEIYTGDVRKIVLDAVKSDDSMLDNIADYLIDDKDFQQRMFDYLLDDYYESFELNGETFEDGEEYGYEKGYDEGYEKGYADGYEEGYYDKELEYES